MVKLIPFSYKEEAPLKVKMETSNDAFKALTLSSMEFKNIIKDDEEDKSYIWKEATTR